MIKITEYPAVIQTPCKSVERPFSDLAGRCWEMIEFVRARNGYGLAAPQTGDFRTYFVVNFGPKPLIAVNPSVILLVDGNGYKDSIEGCYSCLGKMFKVKRAKKIQLEFYSLLGQKQSAILTGLLAVIAQHEFDHLNQKCICSVGKEWNHEHHKKKLS